MLKILIADDHPLIRRGLRQILTEALYVDLIDEAEDGNRAVQMAATETYDVLILDISLPGRDGIEVLRQVKLSTPKLPVLILSIQPEEQFALRVLKLGAAGSLNKASAPEELVNAVKQVVSGGHYISPKVEELLLHDLQSEHEQLPHRALSDREFQVMISIAQGKSLKDIGNELSLSVKTVSTYRTRLLEKMGLQNNAQLVRYVYSNKLMS